MKEFSLIFMSFGRKYGIPEEANLVFDAREMPNPFRVKELTLLSGLDKEVKDYLKSFPQTQETIDSIVEYVSSFLKLVQAKNRKKYYVCIGCSGGRHRSVYITEEVAKHFKDKYQVSVIHRDIMKDLENA